MLNFFWSLALLGCHSIDWNICAYLKIHKKNAVKFIYHQTVRPMLWFSIDRFSISWCTFRFVFEIISICLGTLLVDIFLFMISIRFKKRKCWTSTWSWILSSPKYVLSHVLIFRHKICVRKKGANIRFHLNLTVISTNSKTRVTVPHWCYRSCWLNEWSVCVFFFK